MRPYPITTGASVVSSPSVPHPFLEEVGVPSSFIGGVGVGVGGSEVFGGEVAGGGGTDVGTVGLDVAGCGGSTYRC